MTAPLDARLIEDALACFRPTPVPSTVDFARDNITLSAATSAEPGPLTFSKAQAGIAEAIDDEHTRIVAVQVASQWGKSALVTAGILRTIAADPGPTMLVLPTESNCADFVKSSLDPLIAESDIVRPLVGQDIAGGKRKGGAGGDGSMFKSFPGGFLALASAHKPEDLARRPIRRLFCDEIDRFPPSAGREGDPVLLATKRTRTFRDSKVVLISSPTLPGASRINQWFERGTREVFRIPCPACGALDEPSFERVKWEAGAPKSATLECSHCGERMNEAQRQRALELGEWVATNPAPEEGIRSFKAGALTSKFVSLQKVAAEFESAKTPAETRVFFNTTLGEVWDIGADTANDPDVLASRAEPIRAPYPTDITFVTAGVDLNQGRFEVTLLGHGKRRKIVLDHATIGGDLTTPDTWSRLEAHLRQPIHLANGVTLPIMAAFIDSGGHWTASTYAFSVRNPRWFAIKGVSGFGREPISLGKELEGTRRRLVRVAVDEWKFTAAKLLQRDTSQEGHIALPDHLGPEYFAGLTSEQLKVTYNKYGFPTKTWKKDPAIENEPWDCLVYALAASHLVKTPASALNAPKRPGNDLKNLAAKANSITLGDMPANRRGA